MTNTPINAPRGSAIPDRVASPTDFSQSTPDRIKGVIVAIPSGMLWGHIIRATSSLSSGSWVNPANFHAVYSLRP